MKIKKERVVCLKNVVKSNDEEECTIGTIGSDKIGRIVGILEPGRHELGTTSYDERIMAIDHDFVVNGIRLEKGKRRKIRQGTKLTIETKNIVCFMRQTINRE